MPESVTSQLKYWYGLAKENRDNKRFFNYLFQYVNVIANDKELMKTVNDMRLVEILHAPDNDKRLEVLRKYSLPAMKQGRMMNEAERIAFDNDMIRAIESSRIKDTQLTYCWLKIYNSFYNVYRYDFTVESMHRVTRFEPKLSAPASEEQKLILSKVTDVYELQVPENGEKANLEKINQDIANFEPPEEQAVYVTSLDIFNSKFVSHLDKSGPEISHQDLIQGDNHIPPAQPRKDKEYATLSFHGSATPTVEYKGVIYIFDALDEQYDPWKIISWCLSFNQGKEMGLSDLREKAEVNAPKGIKEALRKSPLFMKSKNKKGALSPFLKGVSHQYITVLNQTSLSDEQLKNIEAAASEIREI